MLALLAAAALSAAPAQAEPAASRALPAPAARSILTIIDSARTAPLREARLCKGAGRMMTAYEPALLYRQQPGDRPRLLIEMPEATACLLGGVDGASVVPGGGR